MSKTRVNRIHSLSCPPRGATRNGTKHTAMSSKMSMPATISVHRANGDNETENETENIMMCAGLGIFVPRLTE